MDCNPAVQCPTVHFARFLNLAENLNDRPGYKSPNTMEALVDTFLGLTTVKTEGEKLCSL